MAHNMLLFLKGRINKEKTDLISMKAKKLGLPLSREETSK